jgi:GAF domain-containing protein
MSEPPRETLAPGREQPEQALRRELRRAYEQMGDITSRLLLANEAADAALSSHDRTELAEKLLRVAASGTQLRRAALFLADPDGFSVAATLGLNDEEQQALASSAADIDACTRALESGEPLVLAPELLAPGAVESPGRAEEPAAENGEPAGEEDDAPGEDEEAAEEEDGADSSAEARADEDEVEEAEDGREGEDGPPGFGVYLPVRIEDTPVAVLALGERSRGRAYERDDVVFLEHLLRQFAVAFNRSVLIEQNQERLREFDALLRVSREITSTLDLDAVLRAVVNTVAAVVDNDRAEIALVRGGRLVLRAVSGMTRLDADQAELFKLGGPLEYLRLQPSRLHLGADDLGGDDAPPGAGVFEAYFGAQEMRSFMALPLRDDQGLLGVLCIESRQDSWALQPAEGDALDILAAQTTVAIRNATLYSEIPLRGVARPVSRLRARVLRMGSRARVALGVALGATLLALLLPVFPERTGGPAELHPLRFLRARATTEGVVAQVLVRGGERVREGQALAVIEDIDLASRIAGLAGDIDLLRHSIAAAQRSGDAARWRSGQIRLAALERSLAFEQRRARSTVLTAPLSGQVLELDLARQLGAHMRAGDAFCTVAALDSMVADVEIPQEKVARVRVGQPAAVKLQAFPTRTFRGTVSEVGWRAEPDARGIARFLVRVSLPNPGERMRPGMSGIARTVVGRRAPVALALEPILRAIQLGWW